MFQYKILQHVYLIPYFALFYKLEEELLFIFSAVVYMHNHESNPSVASCFSCNVSLSSDGC